MRPYMHLRLEQFPDVADLKAEGRKTRVGRLDGRSMFRRVSTKHANRRRLKRIDRRVAEKVEAE